MGQIAVIVPVYKVELLLRRCVDSILAQTFSDISLILIDDGSPDSCPEICDEYARKDPRVHVIHQENGGPSVARNNGIDWVFLKSNCRYVTFVDSDDCIHPEYLERLYYAATTSGTDASMCRHQYIGPYDSYGAMKEVYDCKVCCMDAESLMIEQSSSFNYAWGKLFSRSCFAELRYPEDVSFGEDNMVIYRALFGCGKIAFVDDRLYFYFYNPDGITKSSWSARSLDVFKGIEEQLHFYRENGFERAYQKEIELYIQQCAYQIHRIREDRSHFIENKPYLTELGKQMRRVLRENRAYQIRKNFFWFEALHPCLAAIWSIQIRLRDNFRNKGVWETLRKVIKKCISFLSRKF